MRQVALLFVVFASLFFAGCEDNPPPISDKDESSTAGTTGGEDPINTAEEEVPEDAMPKITDLKVGNGDAAAEGDMVWVLYKGTFKDGEVFDTNRKPDGAPYMVLIGSGHSVPGFERAIKGMKVGGLRKSEVPPLLGYGKRGSANIPPNSDLIFEIEAIHLVKKGREREYGAKDLSVGKGPECQKGDKIKVHYTGKLLNGNVFDSSLKKGTPYTFTLGNNEVIQGWDAGVVGMKVGGKRKLVVPPALGYGDSAYGDIPPASVLVFEIELLEIVK